MPNYQMSLIVNYNTDADEDKLKYRVEFNDACASSAIHMASLLIMADGGVDKLGSIPMYDHQGNDVTEKVGSSMHLINASVKQLFA